MKHLTHLLLLALMVVMASCDKQGGPSDPTLTKSATIILVNDEQETPYVTLWYNDEAFFYGNVTHTAKKTIEAYPGTYTLNAMFQSSSKYSWFEVEAGQTKTVHIKK